VTRLHVTVLRDGTKTHTRETEKKSQETERGDSDQDRANEGIRAPGGKGGYSLRYGPDEELQSRLVRKQGKGKPEYLQGRKSPLGSWHPLIYYF